MIAHRYAWLIWSSAFLLPWLAAYAASPRQRKTMLRASLFTTPLGLTQPLFVPAYWDPPSLFGLAQSTGFDIESLIFCFGIGGNGVVIHNLLKGYGPAGLPASERTASRHRLHSWALLVPFVSFPLLNLFPWNPIYPAITAMVLGALATLFCRPDLAPKIGVGASVFFGYYMVFMFGLEWTAPGYVERVWNLPALSGLEIAGLPMEEFLFAAAFSACFSGIYEHLRHHAHWLSRGNGPRLSSRMAPKSI
jgi:Lycopene cyclase